MEPSEPGDEACAPVSLTGATVDMAGHLGRLVLHCMLVCAFVLAFGRGLGFALTDTRLLALGRRGVIGVRRGGLGFGFRLVLMIGSWLLCARLLGSGLLRSRFDSARSVLVSISSSLSLHELHAALRTSTRPGLLDLRVHRARVGLSRAGCRRRSRRAFGRLSRLHRW